jgi:TolB-like protein
LLACLLLANAATATRVAHAADAPKPAGAKPAGAKAPTVAVLYFDYEGKRDELAVLKTGLAQILISDLGAVDSCRVVERARLQALLDEQKLGQSGKIDRATAARVGKLLGAQMLVLGSFFDLGTTLRVDARLVEVETGRILHTVGANGKGDDFMDIERKIAVEMEQALRQQAVEGAPAAQKRPAPPRPARLKTTTAIKYSRALALADKGDRPKATAGLREVLTEQPDFQLARADLDRLLQ